MNSSAGHGRNIDRALVRAAMAAPLLTAETEQELAIAWRDRRDSNALHKLTEAYLRLVIAMAAKFKLYGLPLADLVQEGTIGLMLAADRFEPEREVRFSTYATWWIRAAIQDFILRNWSIVRTGTTASQKSLFFNLRRLRALIHEDGREHLSANGREEIARRLNVTTDDVARMEARIATSDRSLNAPIADNAETNWQDLLVDDAPRPDEIAERNGVEKRRHQWLEGALKVLSKRELTIIRERRLSDEGLTLEALGEKLGISKERVRQIEQLALRKLKAALLSAVQDPIAAGMIGS